MLEKKFPRSATLLNIHGVVSARLGLLDTAIKSYNKALSLEPNFATAYSNRGNALKEQNRLKEAIKSYREALIINPSFTNAYNNLICSQRERPTGSRSIQKTSQYK